VEGVGDKMVYPRGWSGRRQRSQRWDIGASEKVGNEMTTHSLAVGEVRAQ
jgi:hypothetical protein